LKNSFFSDDGLVHQYMVQYTADGIVGLIPMYTLGHNFEPANIHAGGLRYHGAGAIVSQLLKDRLIEAVVLEGSPG